MFSWSITLPERRSSGLASTTKPCATLHIESDERAGEELSLPAAVGSVLSAKEKAGELHPTGRGELLLLVQETTEHCAAIRIEKLINRRDYTTLELDQKLKLDGYEEELRRRVIGRAVECGLVSNERYGASFVRSKLASGWGLLRIERELRERGVEPQALRGWPKAFLDDAGGEYERALATARRHGLPERRGVEKLARYLYQRGYSSDCALRAARAVAEEVAC